ncbi:hypothetical protein ACJJIK_05615 [Microbulbifer sp. ZKSA006]|uniref:hypothetical protein n=1 Tax=Microbulbifer sp. ZKSA006 TaxID=3243390 RepID=UPI004039C545
MIVIGYILSFFDGVLLFFSVFGALMLTGAIARNVWDVIWSDCFSSVEGVFTLLKEYWEGGFWLNYFLSLSVPAVIFCVSRYNSLLGSRYAFILFVPLLIMIYKLFKSWGAKKIAEKIIESTGKDRIKDIDIQDLDLRSMRVVSRIKLRSGSDPVLSDAQYYFRWNVDIFIAMLVYYSYKYIYFFFQIS